MMLILSLVGLYIFVNCKVYVWCYVYFGFVGMGLFVLFLLICIIVIVFINYSSINQLIFECVQQVLMDCFFQVGKVYNFMLIFVGDEWKLVLIDGESGKNYFFDVFKFGGEQKLVLKEIDVLLEGECVNLCVIIQNCIVLNQLIVVLLDDSKVIMSFLCQFFGIQFLYIFGEDGVLINNQIYVKYCLNNDVGFYQLINVDGSWGNEKLSLGYIVIIGWDNFICVFYDEGIQKLFFVIFVWMVVFLVLIVVLIVVVGMIFVCLVQWEVLKGKVIYCVLLILLYVVLLFILILIFKGLFNQSFGEINMMFSMLFGIKLVWFSDLIIVCIMIIIVNIWLGYLYMMILCMGLLKVILDDLYEVLVMDGVGLFQNFFKIIFLLLIKLLMLLMIVSFVFNFNNFVLI